MGAAANSTSAELWTERDRIALLGLWAIPGLGPLMVDDVRAFFGGSVGAALDHPIASWANGAQLRLPVPVRARLFEAGSLEALAEQTLRGARAARMRVSFIGEPEYPERLARTADAPPLLFSWGDIGHPRRRAALVGSRRPDGGFLFTARRVARELAEAGVGIVSGGADGVDRACHFGALDARGETWAFVGAALDELDAAQAKLLKPILDAGGAFFSELPPGVRSTKATFPRRNRLISAASDAVVIMRAAGKSGALHTATAALRQRRPLLAMPGDADNSAAVGCNYLLQQGLAKLCMGSDDVLLSLGLPPHAPRPRTAAEEPALEELTEPARQVYALLSREPIHLEALGAQLQLESAEVTAALVELELAGLCLQRPGKMYEKV